MKDVAFLVVCLIASPLAAVSLTLSIAGYGRIEAPFSPWVDANGNIRLPESFREGWTHLGSWFVSGENGDSTFHDVYTERESARYFREHHEFPDGATLVKEVRKRRSGKMTTGQARWADETTVWFVMVKDAKRRFPENPLWGDGWGWVLYDASDPTRPVTRDYTRECKGCHIPAQDTDWVYVQGYPTLQAAQVKETRREVAIENLSFTPQVLRVKRGETITWVNRDDFTHTVTADDESFDTGSIAPGQSASLVLRKTGTFSYSCSPHPFMKGSVVVEE